MTTQELEKLKSKIADAERDAARAEGAIQQIEAKWLADYEVKTVAEVEIKIETLKKRAARLEERRTELSAQIDAALKVIE